jgi:hypothetical protein
VCSILCLLPEGNKKKSEIQYTCENTPANWLFQYKYQPEKNVLIKNLNAKTLKDCIQVDTEDMKVFEDIFNKDLENAMEYVKNDLSEDCQDSIDIIARAVIAKKRKLCSNGHINYNVKTNRKICDRQSCKANLDMSNKATIEVTVDDKKEENEKIDKQSEKAKVYLSVPNILPDDKPKELAVGATAVNPNTKDRIAKVLDEILEAADMKNNYSVKIIVSANNVTKVFQTSKEFRKTCGCNS